MVKVFLIDDHVVVREALHNALDKNEGIEVIGEAGDSLEGAAMIKDNPPDVIIMDIAMTPVNCTDATKEFIRILPEVKVLALSMHSDRALVLEMIKAGAKGFLLKQCNLREMVKAIHTLAGGHTYLSPAVANYVVDGFLGQTTGRQSPALDMLSGREQEVLQLIAEGVATREIAHSLDISISTVETHRRQIKQKLGIDHQAGLIKFAIREGLTSL